jgi:hypothetical protein
MLVRPKDLPTAEDMRVDPALERIVNWKEPQAEESAEQRDPATQVAFAEKSMPGFFKAMRGILSR